MLSAIFSFNSIAQITITSADIGSTGDTMRYSNSSILNPSNVEATDTNFTWDFSQLVPNSQSFNEYQSVSSTSIIYSVAFIGKANQASPRGDMGMMNITINNGFNFYSKSSSQYKLVGYGGEMSGTPVPVVFNNPDIIYRFPMVYGNIDSCDSDWSVGLSGTGYIEEDLHRVNTVDGWGTLITPMGSYTCLRLKSEVLQDDSIYIAASGMAMRIPQRFTEYIWLAKGMDFPIMKAIVPEPFIGQVDIIYMDTIRQFVGLNELAYNTEAVINIWPNPANNQVKISVNAQEDSQISIIDSHGKLVYSANVKAISTQHIQTGNWAKGIYFIRLSTENKTISKKLIIQ